MVSSRDLRFDGLKFLLIYLVVLGHLTFNDSGIGVKNMIYSFHMPVFVFLSGYFTSLSSDKDKRFRWVKEAFVIFIVAHVAQKVLLILMGLISGVINGYAFQLSSVLNWDVLMNPGFALWYLMSLIYWRIAAWLIADKVNGIVLFIVSCIVAILVGFVPLTNEFSFQRTFSFAPFFVMGIVFKRRHLLGKLEKIPVVYAIIGIVIGLILARTMAPYYPVNHYATWGGAVHRIKQTLLALFLCPLIIRVSRCRLSEYFARLGSKSLWIYIGHTFLIILGHRIAHFLGWSVNLIGALLIAAFYCLLIVLIAKTYEAFKRRKTASQVSE